MTYAEICRHVAKHCKVPEDQVRKIADCLVSTTVDSLVEGDEVKLKGLGTFYSKNYLVPKMELEFGNKSAGGERRRIRFRPFDSTNATITERWRLKNPKKK